MLQEMQETVESEGKKECAPEASITQGEAQVEHRMESVERGAADKESTLATFKTRKSDRTASKARLEAAGLRRLAAT